MIINKNLFIMLLTFVIVQASYHSLTGMGSLKTLAEDESQVTMLDLFEAVSQNDLPQTSQLIEMLDAKGQFDVNAFDAKKMMLIHYAARNGNREIVALLLTYSTTLVNNCDKNWGKYSPAHWAIHKGHTDVALFICAQNDFDAETKNGNGETTLHCASRRGDTPVARYLLKTYPNMVNDLDKYGNTPLHLAASYGCVEIVQMLLDLKALTTVLNQEGLTALLCAAQEGHAHIFNMLFLPKTEEEFINLKGKEAFQLAVKGFHETICEKLLTYHTKLGNLPPLLEITI